MPLIRNRPTRAVDRFAAHLLAVGGITLAVITLLEFVMPDDRSRWAECYGLLGAFTMISIIEICDVARGKPLTKSVIDLCGAGLGMTLCYLALCYLGAA